jgi:lysophospholipase L1-like esterase
MFVGVSPVWGDGAGWQPNLLPYRSRIVFAGDSLTAQGFTGTRGNEQESWVQRGYAPWAHLRSGNRCYVGSKPNFGVSGDTTTQLLARFSDVTAVSPKVCCLLIGTNDLGLGITSTTQSNIASMISQLRAIDCKIVLIKILPRGSTAVPMSAQSIADWESNNAWIASQAASDVKIVDTESLIGAMDAEHTMLDTMCQPSEIGGTQLHLNSLGAYTVGGAVATAISEFVASGDDRATSDTTNPIPTNGFFTGTSGNATNGTTGTVADGWTVSASASVSGGATLVASKGTLSEGVGASQIITASGTYTGSNRIIRVSRAHTFDMNVGEYWQARLTVKIDPGFTSNIIALQAFVQAQNLQTMSNATIADAFPASGEFNFESIPFKITSATTSSNMWAQAVLKNTGGTDAVSAAVAFGRYDVVQVTA